MIDWLPYAGRAVTFKGAGAHLEGEWKIVLHSTEGDLIDGALNTYHKTLSYPHITVGDKRIEQHCPLTVAATALQNASGGVQTNRCRAIQIEVVGRATKISQLPQGTRDNLRRVIATLQAEFDITSDVPEFQAYPDSYGIPGVGTSKNRVRFSGAKWRAFNGICGHQHVPENYHGDPGLMNVKELLASAPVSEESEEEEMANDAARTVRWNYRNEVGMVSAVLVAREDGGTEHYNNVPFYGNMTNLKPQDKLEFEKVTAAAAIDHENLAAGYILFNQKGQAFHFTPELATQLRKEGRI